MSSISAPPWFRATAVSLLLFCGTVLLFSRATRFGFVNYDDPVYVTDNPNVQGGLSWAGVKWAFTERTDYWHPLTSLSHMLDWELYGPDAFGHHVTSVLWHALNAVLAFFVFRRLAHGFRLSALAAAVFAWHPLRVESVAWITERKDVMSGAFFLLTVLAYACYVDDRRAGRPWRRAYLLTLASFVAGLMSKPMLVTLPLILLILDFWPFARCSVSPARLRLPLLEKAPFFALSGLTAVVTILMQREERAFVLDLPFEARAGNAVISIARYLGKFFWPVDLIVCYPHPGYWPAVVVLGASALVLALSFLAWQQRGHRPWIAAGWLWYLVALLPVIGLVQVGFQAMADRYTYLPMFGIELALFLNLQKTSNAPRVRAGVTAAMIVILAACVARTWDQQGVWRDSVSLFEHAVAVTERNDIAEDFLASALFAANRLEEAAVHAERARALNPHNPTAPATLAGIRERQGRFNEAIELYRAALALRPDDPAVQCQLGLLELHSGRTGEASRLMVPALRTTPALRMRTLELAHLALQQRDTVTARFLYELVVSVASGDAEAHAGIGSILLAEDNAAGALTHLRAAVEREPGLADAQLALARCAEQLGRTDEATRALERALAAAPNDFAIHRSAAEIYAQRRDFPTAVRLYRRAVELAPDDAGAHAALGYMLLLTGDRAGGVAAWRRALELDPDFPGLHERLKQQER